MSDSTQEYALIVGGYQFGMSPDDPAHMVLRLSATQEGPHHSFLFDAPTLDRLATACREAAAKIRSRAS